MYLCVSTKRGKMNKEDMRLLKETYEQILKEVEPKRGDKKYAKILQKRIRELE